MISASVKIGRCRIRAICLDLKRDIFIYSKGSETIWLTWCKEKNWRFVHKIAERFYKKLKEMKIWEMW